MHSRLLLVIALALGSASTVGAAVYKRVRSDGTIEFTNAPRGHRAWKYDSSGGAPAGEPAETARPTRPQTSGVVWTREHSNGVVEFTNLQPIGARWKVLFRFGPGKASSARGGSDTVPPRDLSPARYSRYDDHIRDQQAYYGIPQALVRAVIRTESDYDPNVVSSAGAQGLMQLMPATARSMGVTDVWDPRQNIMGGARYLQLLARRYCRTPAVGGAEGVHSGFICSFAETIKVVAGYHAGPGAVDKYAGLPPYETTRQYVTMVLSRFEEYRRRESSQSDWAESLQSHSR